MSPPLTVEAALAQHTATLANPHTAWDARASALRAVAALADDSDGSPAAVSALTSGLPALAPHLAAAVGELRSAVVRDACAAVSALSNGLGPAFAAVAAEPLTPVLLRASRVTIAVVAASAASAAQALYTCCALGVPPRVTGFLATSVLSRGEKSHPAARAAAAEYLGLLVEGGVMESLPDRVSDEVQAAIAAGCTDSAEFVRDISRANWRRLRAVDSRRAALVLEKMPANAQQLLSGSEFRAAPAGGAAMMPTPVSKGAARGVAGAPRRAGRVPMKAESDVSSSPPPVVAKPPKPPPRKPPVLPKRGAGEAGGAGPAGTAEAVRARRDPPGKAKPNPFAKRPARRSMAIGGTTPLYRPEPAEAMKENVVSTKEAVSPPSAMPAVSLVPVKEAGQSSSAITAAGGSGASSSAAKAKLEELLRGDVAPMSKVLSTSRSLTDVSRPEPLVAFEFAPALKVDAAPVAPTTPSPAARRRHSMADSEADESEFSSARGSPTPPPSSIRMPSPARPGLSAILDDSPPEFSPGSPVFPPTPEAVKQAARKARISFMCGPNVSPGPFDAPSWAVRAPPVAMMLPIREHRRMSLSSQSSRSATASPSSSQSRSIDRSMRLSDDQVFGLTREAENDAASLSAAVAAFDLGDEQSISDQVAVSALLDMNRGVDVEKPPSFECEFDGQQPHAGADDADIQAYLEPLPVVPEVAASKGQDDELPTISPARSEESSPSMAASPPSQLPAYASDEVVPEESLTSAQSDENVNENAVKHAAVSAVVVSNPEKLLEGDTKRGKEHAVIEMPKPANRVKRPSGIAHRASTPVLPRTCQQQETSPDLERPADRSIQPSVRPRVSSVSGSRGAGRSYKPTSEPRKLGASRPVARTAGPSRTTHSGGTRGRGTFKGSSPTQQLSKQAHGKTRVPGEAVQKGDMVRQPSKGFTDALRRVELSKSSGWQARVSALTRLQEACKHVDGDAIDVRLALRAFSVLSEMTTDMHIKVVPTALDALFAVFLGVENSSSNEGSNPLQVALERRPEVIQRILVCLVDSRASTRSAAERVMHSLVAQFRPEVRAMQIVRAMSHMFSADNSRKGATNIGSPKVMVVGCTHLLAAFRSAEASGDGFVWQPVSLLASLLETTAVLLRDRRADVRGAAGPVILAANLSLPPGAMKLALDALSLSLQDRTALQSVLAASGVRESSDQQDSCRSETSVAGS